MADENNEDDSWLYGSSNENQDIQSEPNDSMQTNDVSIEKDANHENLTQSSADDSKPNEMSEEDDLNAPSSTNGEQSKEEIMDETDNGTQKEDKDDDDDDSDDDSDEDDIVVTIRDIQPASTFNIKQRGAATTAGGAAPEKPKTNLGKFSIEEFESIGTIAGQTAIEFNVETIEDKPWRKPGADITDYFNYGFSEETWRSYCERQKRMRHESGTSISLANSNSQNMGGNNASRTLTSVTSGENNKFSSGNQNSHSGPPHGSYNRNNFGSSSDSSAKENPIQVMTAERREYSRAKGKFDVTMTMPPPPPFNMGNEPFFPEDNYCYGYEPTQEHQWNNDNCGGWVPSGIKELTPGPQQMMGPPPPHMNMNINMNMPPPPSAMMPPLMNPSMPPQMVPPPPQHNMNMMPVPPPNQMPMMPPPNIITSPQMPPNAPNRSDEHRGNPNEYREHDDKRGPPPAWRRDKDREYREHEEADRRRERDRYRDRERERERERGSSRRERSRSRERSERRRRSKSRDRKSRDKKKSHKKDKEDSD